MVYFTLFEKIHTYRPCMQCIKHIETDPALKINKLIPAQEVV